MDFCKKIPPFLSKLITFVKQNTHNLAGIPAKAGSFPTLDREAFRDEKEAFTEVREAF